VLAVGNPFNLTSTVTAGIVSAKARTLGVYNGGIESFIQTDAAINQGNSGGALVNTRGELVGINAVLSSPTGAYAGYGFAIPTSIMTKVVGDLKEFGAVQRAILGISGYDLGDERSKDKDLGVVEGVYVADVTDGSGAKAAGIEPGDVIVKIAGKKVHNMAELQENIAKHRPGDKVEVTIVRNKKEKDIDVTLKNLQGNTEVVKKFDLDMLGAAFKPIDDDMKRHLGVSYGLQVTGIDKGKLADAGIKKGFIILKVNGSKIATEEDLAEVLKAANQSPERVLFISGYYTSGRRANYAVELGE
jgi:S1-C subfamily serine protease